MKNVVLKIITKIQKFLLKSQRKTAINLYYYLAKLHFKIHFDRDLEGEILNNSAIGYMAVKRHSRLVLKVMYKDSPYMAKKIARYGSRSSFIKNILLETKL